MGVYIYIYISQYIYNITTFLLRLGIHTRYLNYIHLHRRVLSLKEPKSEVSL